MARTNLPPAHPLARFQLLSSPLVIPGKCAVCGSPSRPVVDFGMTLEFYGAVYLCVVCLTEAGRVINMVTAEEFTQAEADSSRSFAEQLNAREMRVISNEQYDTLTLALGMLHDAVLSANSSDLTVVAGETSETGPTLFDSSKEYNDGDNRLDDENLESTVGNTEQDNNAAVGEGPISVPDSDSTRSSFDF